MNQPAIRHFASGISPGLPGSRPANWVVSFPSSYSCSCYEGVSLHLYTNKMLTGYNQMYLEGAWSWKHIVIVKLKLIHALLWMERASCLGKGRSTKDNCSSLIIYSPAVQSLSSPSLTSLSFSYNDLWSSVKGNIQNNYFLTRTL